jgi:hypothetical protein
VECIDDQHRASKRDGARLEQAIHNEDVRVAGCLMQSVIAGRSDPYGDIGVSQAPSSEEGVITDVADEIPWLDRSGVSSVCPIAVTDEGDGQSLFRERARPGDRYDRFTGTSERAAADTDDSGAIGQRDGARERSSGECRERIGER